MKSHVVNIVNIKLSWESNNKALNCVQMVIGKKEDYNAEENSTIWYRFIIIFKSVFFFISGLTLIGLYFYWVLMKYFNWFQLFSFKWLKAEYNGKIWSAWGNFQEGLMHWWYLMHNRFWIVFVFLLWGMSEFGSKSAE